MNRRRVAWALAAPVIIFACAANETATPGNPEQPPPPAIIDGSTGDAVSSSDSGDGPIVDRGVCGDEKVGVGEECDDGNNTSGDGCSASCRRESAGPSDVCPGVAVALTGAGAETRKGAATGKTSGTYPHYSASCGGGTGKDAVYVVTPDVTGLLTAKLTSTFDSILYARRTCADDKTESACNDAKGSEGGEVIKVAVKQGEPMYLFVDGYAGSTGDFTLEVEVATAFCGNGVAELPEACDDGDTVAGDGCAPDCTLESGGVLGDCPGQDARLIGAGAGSRKISFAGTTAGLPSSTLSPSVCSGSGPNAVYAITPDVDGSMTAKLVANFDNATLHIRTECDIDDTQLDCREATEPLQTLELTAPVRAGLPTYVVVDASSSLFSGTYVLDVAIQPAQCGNRILDGNEQCDDGNAVAGDGCADDCKLEANPPGIDVCPGATLPLVAGPGGTFISVVTATTTPLNADYKPKSTENGCGTLSTTKDAVFVVTSPIDGLMEATVSAAFDAAVYARTGCDSDAAAFSDLACAGRVDGNGAERITFPVSANTPVWVIVDSEATTAHGVFELGLVVTPGQCGNGALEGGETCDDGNAAGGDGCSTTCQLEPPDRHDTCVNAEPIALAPVGASYSASVSSGTTNLTHDQQFTGCSSTGRDAIYTVKAPIDGVMSVEIVSPTFNVSVGARTTCPTSTTAAPVIVCSNVSSGTGPEEIQLSVVRDETYYVVVDGTAAAEFGTFTMLVNIRPPGCGDGLMSGGEQCDDGNTTNGDGCSATCTVETLAGLDTCPGYALALTGAGAAPRSGVVTLDTSTLTANYAGNCGGSSKEGVVVVTPPINGRLTAKLTGMNYQPILHARTTCLDAKTEKACDDDAPAFSSASRDITITGVTAGTPIYLFVDGYNGSAGVGRLNVTVTP